MSLVFAVQKNNEWDSVLSQRFGRATGYLKYSKDTNKLTYHSNEENVNAGHGAGIQASQAVINLEADSVMTGGSIGPKAFEVLKKSGVKVYSQLGEISVHEAFEDFKNGQFQETLSSNN